VTTLIILIVVGGIAALGGLLVVVFREPYATWWNVQRQNTRRPRPGTFTPRWSVFYGVLFLVLGLLILLVNVLRLSQLNS
jgi:hypothetical protein